MSNYDTYKNNVNCCHFNYTNEEFAYQSIKNNGKLLYIPKYQYVNNNHTTNEDLEI